MLRPIQFVVHPVLVNDDGECLTPIDIQPVVVSSADWLTFATEQWPEMLATLESQLLPDNITTTDEQS